ncbi:hypothetical protein COO60DRAFT_1001079 [Scenedesmus sp. NREL 46B-D3]|nr:hypothetical protein COO60DRAFT_1001079 [Scenedesmus sp. NREL 46B-D3]
MYSHGVSLCGLRMGGLHLAGLLPCVGAAACGCHLLPLSTPAATLCGASTAQGVCFPVSSRGGAALQLVNGAVLPAPGVARQLTQVVCHGMAACCVVQLSIQLHCSFLCMLLHALMSPHEVQPAVAAAGLLQLRSAQRACLEQETCSSSSSSSSNAAPVVSACWGVLVTPGCTDWDCPGGPPWPVVVLARVRGCGPHPARRPAPATARHAAPRVRLASATVPNPPGGTRNGSRSITAEVHQGGSSTP